MQPPPFGPPPGYGQPPPRSSGLPVALIVAIGASAFVLLALFGVGFAWGLYRARKATHAPVDPAKVVLSERYASKNGLIVAHYPADFAAKHVDEATVMVSRTIGKVDEFATLGAIPVASAVSDDVGEFARLMIVGVEKNVAAKGGSFERGEKRDAKCLGKYPGVAYSPTFTLFGNEYVGEACFFRHQDRLYVTRYDLGKSRAAADRALLERIVRATELPDPEGASGDPADL